MMPTISIILTSYNHAKFLRESIESVLNQTFQDYELIIVDDASQDESWEIIQSYAEDERVIALRNEKNIRTQGVYNAIQNIAQGKYIAIHHSDDIWMPKKLEKQMSVLESKTDYAAVFTWVEVINEEGNKFVSNKEHFYANVFKQPNRNRFEWLNYFFYQGNALCHPSILIRRECYWDCELFNFGFAQIPDFLKWIKLCLKHEIFIIQEPLTKFRILNNERNTSGDRLDAHLRSNTELFIALKEYLKIRNADEFVQIFPSAEKYKVYDDFISEYALARICLDPNTSNIYKLFGFTLLFDLVNDKNKSDKILKLYNFSYLDLISETGKYDIFHIISDNRYQKATLFIDFGNGFSDDKCISISHYLSVDGVFSFEFDLNPFLISDKKPIKALRFDPNEGYFSRCRINKVITNGIFKGIESKNAYKQKGWDEFLSDDPIYELNGDFKNATWVRIEGQIEIIDNRDLSSIVSNILSNEEELKENLRSSLQKLDNSKISIEKMQNEISNNVNKLNITNNKLDLVQNELNNKNRELKNIYNSRSWRFCCIIKSILKKVRG